MHNAIAWGCACGLIASCSQGASPNLVHEAGAATETIEPGRHEAGGGEPTRRDAAAHQAFDAGRAQVRDAGTNVPFELVPEQPDTKTPTDAAPPLPAPDAGEPCANGEVWCDGRCTDVRYDPAHCGACATSCSVGFGCHDGRCRAEVGCSDGTREAFASLARHPTIAGCAATWPRASMRAAKTGASCGDTRGPCTVPADACATGWHVCGDDARGPEDLSARVSHAECYAEKGNWAVALGDHSCTDCGVSSSGAVCCGDGCVQQQGDCVWPDATGWFGVVHDMVNLCSATASDAPSIHVGVLCCRSAVGQ